MRMLQKKLSGLIISILFFQREDISVRFLLETDIDWNVSVSYFLESDTNCEQLVFSYDSVGLVKNSTLYIFISSCAQTP